MSIIFVVILPLIPLIIECWYGGKVSARSLTISAAIYAVTTGVNGGLALLSLSVLISVIFSIAFGIVLADPSSALDHCEKAALLAIIFLGIIHMLLRLKSHCLNGDPFIEL